MRSQGMTSVRAIILGLSVVALGSALGSVEPAAAAGAPASQPAPHQPFDDTTGPRVAGLAPGARAEPLTNPKIPLVRASAAPSSGAATTPAQGSSSVPPDPEVLGFVQQGEVSSGSWTSDLHMSLLSTVAYFGVNVNADGSLVTGDAGYGTWWSSQTTNLINAAHNAGDRVVLTVKTFDNSVIAGVTGSETARQNLISAIINQVVNRPADGVNIDFEGGGNSANFTTFISELQNGLNSRAAGRSYLTVDAYASAGLGGTLWDLASLWHDVDAIDLMGYGFAPCVSGDSGPTAPMGGCWYNVIQAVSDYMTKYGVPGSKLLLGVPYYGYKWSVSSVSAGGQDPVISSIPDSADTYSGALSDFGCAQQLQQHWDATFQEPWASWYSPASGDPCGGNYGTYRELYYDNAQSLGIKYDLVNSRALRGIAIWSLGYDSGSNDLWNEITAKFTVTKFPPFRPAAVGQPSVAVLPDGSQQLVFWRGYYNHLFEGWYAGGYWHGPIDLTSALGPSAILESAPTVAVSPDGSTQTVFWQGLDNHLFEAWWAAARWNGPIDITASALGPSGVLTSAPSAAITPDGSTQVVFWAGPGGHLLEAWWGAARWNGPVDWTASAFGGAGLMTSAPSATVTPDGSQLVFWAGAGGHLLEAWWAGSRWNGPADFTASALGGAHPLTTSPSVTVLPDDSQQLVFWTGAGGHLIEAWWGGGRWNGPVDWTAGAFRGTGALTSAPSAAVLPDGSQQLVFWQGASQTLWEAWYAGRWNGPAGLSGG